MLSRLTTFFRRRRQIRDACQTMILLALPCVTGKPRPNPEEEAHAMQLLAAVLQAAKPRLQTLQLMPLLIADRRALRAVMTAQPTCRDTEQLAALLVDTLLERYIDPSDPKEGRIVFYRMQHGQQRSTVATLPRPTQYYVVMTRPDWVYRRLDYFEPDYIERVWPGIFQEFQMCQSIYGDSAADGIRVLIPPHRRQSMVTTVMPASAPATTLPSDILL